MRDGVEGAQGSVLLRSTDEPDVYVGVARWTNATAWTERRGSERLDPGFSTVMGEVATPLSAELFDEVDASLA